MTAEKLQMDAIRLQGIETLNPHLIYKHVLSLPRLTQQHGLYALSVNKPVVLEVELGVLGKEHINQLLDFLDLPCNEGSDIQHVRTDGEMTWVVDPHQQDPRSAPATENFGLLPA